MDSILAETRGAVGVVTLNRPEVMNAWHAEMRGELVAELERLEGEAGIRAVLITGAGDRAFCAGQDLNEASHFDPDRAEEWIREWERLYDTVRSVTKPVVVALNGVAAGSGFQFSLLADLRVGHPGVRMGQPEINAGITSTTGPWIMREIIGYARMVDLTLTGRLMDAEEAHAIGVISRLVPQNEVFDTALNIATELADKPPVAMRLNRMRFREMTEEGFVDCMRAGVRNQRESYATGEPGRMMRKFLNQRSRSGGASR